ncbi:MAG: efflux RND transporter periplasmic adaptor subunit [Desulfovibrio sp.]|jgi:Cu(I)/Ag(I) efflux system membrane fusion protein|nr:efflux RND transporter periplasmic adaptor subunit [Desulfovibrio sp.]
MWAKRITCFAVLPILAFMAGYLVTRGGGRGGDELGDARTITEVERVERRVLYWYDPMYPGTHFDEPGKSPFMDMQLVPRYSDEGAGAGIRIDPVQTQNLAVRTVKVERGNLSFNKEIPANVEFNEYRLAKVQPRAEGFVEKHYSLTVGDTVRAGQELADITVPGWASDQSEYLLLKGQRADSRIIKGVRERLRLSGMPEEMLRAVDADGTVQTRLSLISPIEGVLTSFDVYPGMNVGKDMTIATIQGTNPIWITADVPESYLPMIKGRGRIRIFIPAYPERAFYSDSFTLLPRADLETRTVPLRVSLDNFEGLLRPGMTAGIRLRGSEEESLLIPTLAVIDLGEEQRVILRAPDGSFVPRRIRIRRDNGEMSVVDSGLEEGEEVVIRGLFLIDSEANLRGALERMRRDEGGGHAGHPAGDKQGGGHAGHPAGGGR